ncbi:hypothetical protein [Mucilaginibacter antarcticus]|uniref:hypothetical protein n=3 Tax=Mucilaginibacter antarcticus TaxID=1855725 RepID=UPI003626B135
MDKQKHKQKIIAEYLLGGTSTRKLAIKYGYGHVTISRWVMAHERYVDKKGLRFSKAVMEPDGPLPTDIHELQEALRISRLKVELLEAMIDISDEQFGTDIRKSWHQAVMRVEQSSGVSLSLLCLLSGHSRQAYYKRRFQAERKPIKEEVIVQQVLKHRQLQPRMGGRKLYLSTKGFIRQHDMKLGRDAFLGCLVNTIY